MIDAHDFASRFHFRAERDVPPLITQEWEDRFFHREMFRHDLFGEAKFAQSFSRHHLSRQFGQRNADGLADEWHRARGARINLQHIRVLALDRELHIHQAAHT